MTNDDIMAFIIRIKNEASFLSRTNNTVSQNAGDRLARIAWEMRRKHDSSID